MSYSCSSSQEDKIKTISLHQEMDKGSIELDDKIISFSEAEIIPLEFTTESMLGRIRRLASDDEFIITFEDEAIVLFDAKTGKYISNISRKGNGPGEYQFLWSAFVDFSEKKIYAHDFTIRKILIYSFDGTHLETIENDSICSIAAINKDTFIAYHFPKIAYKYNASIYDKNWNYIKGAALRVQKKDLEKSNEPIISFPTYNGSIFLKPTNDTLYILNQDLAFEKFLFIDEGKYKDKAGVLPINRENFITRFDYRIAKNYMFCEFDYDRKSYYDIWDISTQKLIYRNIESKRGDKAGIALNYKGKTIHAWPSFVENNILYCTLEQDEVSMLELKNDNEGNPVLLRVEIK